MRAVRSRLTTAARNDARQKNRAAMKRSYHKGRRPAKPKFQTTCAQRRSYTRGTPAPPDGNDVDSDGDIDLSSSSSSSSDPSGPQLATSMTARDLFHSKLRPLRDLDNKRK